MASEWGWLSIVLSTDQLRANADTEIEALCRLEWNMASGPKDAALFIDKAKTQDGQMVLYLSPYMALICRSKLDKYGPYPCDPPEFGKVSVLIANGDVRHLLRHSAEARITPSSTAAPSGRPTMVPSTRRADRASDGPINVLPTTYPDTPNGSIIVENPITINLHSAEFVEFSAKLDELLLALQTSNQLAGEVRDKLVAEMKAGFEILKSPKPDPKMIELLLMRPLFYVADKAATALIAALALALLTLLGKMTGWY